MTAPNLVGATLRARLVDPDGYIAGNATYSQLRAVPRWNSPGAWLLTTDLATPTAAALQEGSGLLIEQWTGAVWRAVMSGPVEELSEVLDDQHPGGVLTAAGVDDMVLLGDYVTYPDPTRAATAQTTATQWGDLPAGAPVGNGPVAQVMTTAVEQQLLDTLSDRRIARLEVGPYPPGTATVSLRSRYEPLLAFLQRAAGPYTLGIRVRPQIRRVAGRTQVWRIFEVYTPRDLSTSVEFAYSRGTLLGHSYRRARPDHTHPIVGGAGEGTARTIATGSLPALSGLWRRRIETFLDRRDATDTATLTAAVAEATAEANLAAAPGLSITPVDTAQQAYGVHYDLGDQVAAVIGGTPVIDRVREVELVHDADGLTSRPLIGPEGALTPGRPLTARRVALVDRKASRAGRT